MDESITIRDIDPVLRAALQAEADRRGSSLEDLVVQILSSSLGLAGSTQLFRGLDGLVAGLSLEGFQEQQELDAAQRYLDEMGGLFEGM